MNRHRLPFLLIASTILFTTLMLPSRSLAQDVHHASTFTGLHDPSLLTVKARSERLKKNT